jgi:hypothetical protein
MIAINEAEVIKNQLSTEGKVTYLDQPQHIAAIAAMNEQMEAVRREFQIKDSNSQMTASKVILTA